MELLIYRRYKLINLLNNYYIDNNKFKFRFLNQEKNIENNEEAIKTSLKKIDMLLSYYIIY